MVERLRGPRLQQATSEPEEVFAQRVRARRTQMGWTQVQLAERCQELGVPMDQSTIAKIERAVRGVSLNDAIRLCAALNVSPVFMFFPVEADARVLIGPGFPVAAGVARLWLKGDRPLRMDDDRRSWQEAVLDDQRDLTAEARVIYAMVDDLNDYLVPMENDQLSEEGVSELSDLIGTMKGVLEQLARRALRMQGEAGR